MNSDTAKAVFEPEHLADLLRRCNVELKDKVTDAEGALELLGNVPEEVAEALGRFGAKVVDMLPASLRSQLDKQ